MAFAAEFHILSVAFVAAHAVVRFLTGNSAGRIAVRNKLGAEIVTLIVILADVFIYGVCFLAVNAAGEFRGGVVEGTDVFKAVCLGFVIGAVGKGAACVIAEECAGLPILRGGGNAAGEVAVIYIAFKNIADKAAHAGFPLAYGAFRIACRNTALNAGIFRKARKAAGVPVVGGNIDIGKAAGENRAVLLAAGGGAGIAYKAAHSPRAVKAALYGAVFVGGAAVHTHKAAAVVGAGDFNACNIAVLNGQAVCIAEHTAGRGAAIGSVSVVIADFSRNIDIGNLDCAAVICYGKGHENTGIGCFLSCVGCTDIGIAYCKILNADGAGFRGVVDGTEKTGCVFIFAFIHNKAGYGLVVSVQKASEIVAYGAVVRKPVVLTDGVPSVSAQVEIVFQTEKITVMVDAVGNIRGNLGKLLGSFNKVRVLLSTCAARKIGCGIILPLRCGYSGRCQYHRHGKQEYAKCQHKAYGLNPLFHLLLLLGILIFCRRGGTVNTDAGRKYSPHTHMRAGTPSVFIYIIPHIPAESKKNKQKNKQKN